MAHKTIILLRRPDTLLRPLVRLLYKNNPQGSRNIDYLRCAFFQRLLGFNRRVPWPVHFTSRVIGWERIVIGDRVNPGLSPGCYIQGLNGIRFGSNIRIAPNVVIVSADHDADDYDRHVKASPIQVGSNVWIGANSVILPGVTIGDNVIIGAGSIVGQDIPDNCIAAGSPCRVVKAKAPYKGRTYD
jgi:acetyltransferase-like isoleucine patch superfamily enzyme